MTPLERLRYHVSGAIARGEATAIEEQAALPIAKRIGAWLAGLPHIVDAQPIRATIGKKTFEGARYTQHLTPPPGARNPEPYDREMICLQGDLPAAYRRRRKTCFRFIGDSRDWYVASHCPIEVANDPRASEHHPFGITFQLAPWSVPDGTSIDHYEPRPYTRVGAAWTLV